MTFQLVLELHRTAAGCLETLDTGCLPYTLSMSAARKPPRKSDSLSAVAFDRRTARGFDCHLPQSRPLARWRLRRRLRCCAASCSRPDVSMQAPLLDSTAYDHAFDGARLEEGAARGFERRCSSPHNPVASTEAPAAASLAHRAARRCMVTVISRPGPVRISGNRSSRTRGGEYHRAVRSEARRGPR